MYIINSKILNRGLFFCFVLYLVDLLIYDKIGNSSIGIQDITSVFSIFTIVIYVYSGRFTEHKKIIAKEYIIYIVFLMLSNIFINSFLLKNNIFYLYILKEFIFILIFLIAYLTSYNMKRKVVLILELFIIINICFGVFSLITSRISYYGIGSIVSNAPSQSGIVYLGISILSYFLYLYDGIKNRYVLYIYVSVLLTLLTVSRTAIFGIIIFFSIIFSIKTFKLINNRLKFKVISKRRFIGQLTIIFLIISIVLLMSLFFNSMNTPRFSQNYFIEKIVQRFQGSDIAMDYRRERLEMFQYETNSKVAQVLFGLGKGSPEIIIGQSTLAVDNQFYRLYLEMGLIGIFFWLSIVRKTYKNILMYRVNKYVIVSLSLIITYFIMGISYEVFQVTKSGTLFWLVQGLLMGASKNYNNKRSIE